MAFDYRNRVWTIDGAPCDILDLFEVNDFDADQRREIEVMAPGESLILGGGAGADFILKCENAPRAASKPHCPIVRPGKGASGRAIMNPSMPWSDS